MRRGLGMIIYYSAKISFFSDLEVLKDFWKMEALETLGVPPQCMGFCPSHSLNPIPGRKNPKTT